MRNLQVQTTKEGDGKTYVSQTQFRCIVAADEPRGRRSTVRSNMIIDI